MVRACWWRGLLPAQPGDLSATHMSAVLVKSPRRGSIWLGRAMLVAVRALAAGQPGQLIRCT